MASKTDVIRIEGIEGFEGDYPFDQSSLTWGDLRFIQAEAGIRAGEFDDEVKRGNVELFLAMAKIALRRAQHPHAPRFDEALDKVPLAGPPPVTYIAAEEDEPDPPTPSSEPQ